jgi:hypothetical protein
MWERNRKGHRERGMCKSELLSDVNMRKGNRGCNEGDEDRDDELW